MKNLCIYLSAVLLLLSFIDAEESKMNIVLKHCSSFGNKKFVEKVTTPRKPINRTTSLTSMDIYFWPNVVLDKPLYYRYTAYKKFATEYKPFMVNLRVEVCDALKFRNHPGFQTIADKAKNETSSNMLDPCPIKGHRYIKPYYTVYNHLPPLIPVGMWRVDGKLTKFFDGVEVEIVRSSDYYEISPKGIEEF